MPRIAPICSRLNIFKMIKYPYGSFVDIWWMMRDAREKTKKLIFEREASASPK